MQITETYAFLPREAVTRFLTGCSECARRPRSATPPSLPTPSPSPTRHRTYAPFNHPSRHWEPEKEPFFKTKEYTEPLEKIEIKQTALNLDAKPFDLSPRNKITEPPFREVLQKTNLEIDKNDENSFIDVEEVKTESLDVKNEIQTTRVPEINERKTELKKKYNPLDVENLTSKDPKPKSPLRKKMVNFAADSTEFAKCPKTWLPGDGMYFSEEIDFSVPITTTYMRHVRNLALEEREDLDLKVSELIL